MRFAGRYQESLNFRFVCEILRNLLWQQSRTKDFLEIFVKHSIADLNFWFAMIRISVTFFFKNKYFYHKKFLQITK